MSRWFRHYAGMMGDPKFAGVARLCKRSRAEVLFVWGIILESAAEGASASYEWDADVVGELLNLDTPDAQAIHDAMVAKGLLANGAVASWDRRQFTSDDSSERVKAHRQRRRADRNATGNDDVTTCNAVVTPPETETEPEKKLEAIASCAATEVATAPVKAKARPEKPKAGAAWLTDPDFCAAWDACTAKMRNRSESREKTYAHWKRQAALCGDGANLLHALRAYLKGDDDVKRTGGPGFHVWLSEGRWDHWTTASAVATVRPVWAGPPEIRNAVIRETSSDFAGSYLDTCAWTGEAIQARTGVAADKLRRLRALQHVSILDPIGVAA